MKEHPILFTTEMVRAIIEGRKTQTRRMVTPQPPEGHAIAPRGDIDGWMSLRVKAVSHYPVTVTNVRCPYGVPGDRLWVRETLLRQHDGAWRYAADSAIISGIRAEDVEAALKWKEHRKTKKNGICASFHMPRWASRITLEVTKVRAERVQSISFDDVLAEGVRVPVGDGNVYLRITGKYAPWDYMAEGTVGPKGQWPSEIHDRHDFLRAHYACLWDEINAKRGYPWKSNPWVWAISFKIIEVKGRVAA